MSYNYNNPVENMKIEVGDIVLVVGWVGSGVGKHEIPSWVKDMDNTIGKKYRVEYINSPNSIRLGEIGTGRLIWNYNPAWIKVVDSCSKMYRQLLTM